MPEVLDWQRVADPHAIIQYAVQALRQGRTVAFPTETGYALSASALTPEAVRQLRAEDSSAPLTVAVRGPGEARDWAPYMSPLAQRLTRRLWPGPVTLQLCDLEQGLVNCLPEDVRRQLCVEGTLRLTAPGHEALREVLRHLPGPVVFATIGGEGEEAADAQRVLRLAGPRVDVVIDDGPSRHAQPATVLAVNGAAWQIVEAGVVSAEHIHRLTAFLILFLCTGNTCRSPLAEALCKKRLADRLGCAPNELPAKGFHVLSAGVATTAGMPAAAEAVSVAKSYGADLSAHHSQPLTPELAARADYLIGMTSSHLRAVTDYFGQLSGTTRLLNPAGDIADPIGCAQPVYEACAQQIWNHLERLLAEMMPEEANKP